jgi:hypothetical protein
MKRSPRMSTPQSSRPRAGFGGVLSRIGMAEIRELLALILLCSAIVVSVALAETLVYRLTGSTGYLAHHPQPTSHGKFSNSRGR